MTTFATSNPQSEVKVANVATIEKTPLEGGGYLLTVVGIDGSTNFAFTSYRHAQKHLTFLVGKERIRMVRQDDGSSRYEWLTSWNR